MIPLLANLVGLLAVAIGVVAIFAVQRQRRDEREQIRRNDDTDRATTDRAARRDAAVGAHPAFASALAEAPDAFTLARRNRAAREAMTPADVREGCAPDPDSPRFVWWIGTDAAATLTDAQRATLPPWLRRLVPVYPTRPDRICDPRIGACPFAVEQGDRHAIIITARELLAVWPLPGGVRDLAGGAVPAPTATRAVAPRDAE